MKFMTPFSNDLHTKDVFNKSLKVVKPMLKLTYFILLIILSFYHLLEPLKKKTPTFLTFIGKKYLIKIMSGPVFSIEDSGSEAHPFKGDQKKI